MSFFKKKNEQTYPLGQELPLRQTERYYFLDEGTVSVLKTGRMRILFLCIGFTLLFLVIIVRLFQQTVLNRTLLKTPEFTLDENYIPVSRASIIDRCGNVLAISLPVSDLYVNASEVENPKEMAEDIVSVLPDLSVNEVYEKLASKAHFKYLKRGLSPQEQYRVNALGYPQLNFDPVEKRIYPQGPLFSHILGLTDVDGNGVAGIEKAFNNRLYESKEPIQLSLSLAVQDVVRSTLISAVQKHQAAGGAAIVMDIHTAEVLALVSLPDYNPNLRETRTNETLFNRATVGVYELGSVMKIFTAALGLESGLFKVTDTIDASDEFLKVGWHKITDLPHPEGRILTYPEVLIYSSNIGAAKIGMAVGAEKQQDFFKSLGLMDTLSFELPEKATPLTPNTWGDTTTVTASYGYGLSFTPLHVATAASALVNGGTYLYPTILKDGNKGRASTRVLSEKNSADLRSMMRAVIDIGTAKKANIEGYLVGGKTGSAEILGEDGKYQKGKLRTSFISVFPTDEPKYVVFVTMENPQKLKEHFYFNTAGWNAVPTGGEIIKGIAPVLGIMTKQEQPLPAFMKPAYEYVENKKKK
ncbi:MAG: penicillin-binding protein 2 [Alphaproteobacteria bacterium]|nr:penicillin-binding protein 2 [Alphaproteobacteria bacterium]